MAAGTEFTLTLQFSTGLAGSLNQLTWSAEPGARYRVRSSDGLLLWRERALVEAEGTVGIWLDNEPAGPRMFYEILPTSAEVFAVEPAVLSPGAVLVISGQCLPPGSSVVFEIEGIPPVTAPIVVMPDGRMTVTLPAFDLIPPPGSNLGPLVWSARVVAPDGSTVCPIEQTFEATLSGFANYPPAVSPPASPQGVAIKEKGLPGETKPDKTRQDPARMAGGGDEDGGGGEDEVPMCKTSESKNSLSALPPPSRSARPGEVCGDHCDLALETPAGPQLAFVRTYRSMNQPASICGTGWDHSYNVYITPIYDSAADPAPTRVAVHTGDGHVDVMQRQGAVYVSDGLFREGLLNPDTSFTLTFADQSQFIFCPLVGAPWQGRIASIVDRNGVALTCTYTPGGKLDQVTSQFGQSLTFDYDVAGNLSTVTDQTTRFLSLSYFAAGEPGGNEGDLKSVSCPTIPGETPVRGPVTYSYSTGSADPQLNSNLLTCTDGAGRLVAGFSYSTVPAGSAAYDSCVSNDRFSTDPTEPVMHFSYEYLTNTTGGVTGLLCTAKDELGRVGSTEYDRMHQPLRIRAYTTFAPPGLPVDIPPPPADPTDPAFLESTYEWNPDHLWTRCTEPDGLQALVTYDRELRHDCPRRERGNPRVVTIISPDPSLALRTVGMDYLPGFGTIEGKKGLNAVNVKLARLQSNPYFQQNQNDGVMPMSHMPGPDYGDVDDDQDRALNSPGNPIRGISVKGGKNPGGNIGATDFVAGPGSNPLYDNDAPRGANPLFEGASGFRTRLTTTFGQTFTNSYDTRGNCTSSTTPIADSGTVCTYNALGQLTGVTLLNGPGSSFLCARQHDPVTHYLVGQVVDPDVNGDGSGLSLTTSFVRNALGLITEVVDPRGYSTLISYNSSDQPVSIVSPPLGSDPVAAERVLCTQLYDGGGLPVRCDLEHRDAAGALVAGNPNYTGFCVYNSRGQLVMDATEQKPVDVPPGVLDPSGLDLSNFNAREYTLDHAGQCVRIAIPAASRNQAVDEVCDVSRDALGRISSVTTGGLGTPGAVTTEFRMSTVGQVTQVTVNAAAGGVSPTITCTYDAWRRRSSCTDEMGNVRTFAYDNQGFTTVEVHGEVNDGPGSAGNVLLARQRTSKNNFGDVVLVKEMDSSSPNLKGLRIKTILDGDWSPSPTPLGMAINEKGLPGGSGKKPKPSTHAARPGGGAFFDVFTADDVATQERFAPGEPAPHATETTTVQRSPAGLPLSLTRNGDILYVFGGYDGAARLTSFSRPGAVTVSRSLDACGNITTSTLTAHSTLPGAPDETYTTVASYDAACRQISKSDSAGNTHTLGRDSLSRITSETQPGGLTLERAYDVAGSAGFSSVVVTLPDADGDGLPDYQTSRVCLGGVCSSTTDAEGYTTTFLVDSQSRTARTDFPDGTFETCTYNELGHPVSRQRRDGSVIACDFDNKGRCTTVTVSNLPPGFVAVPPTQRTFDGLNRCVLATEGPSIVACALDSIGNCLSESQNGHTITRSFDHRGRKDVWGPGAECFRDARDAHGRLVSFSSVTAGGVTLSPPVTQRAYLGFACLQDTSRNGVVTNRDYRSDGEPPLPVVAGVSDFTFGGCVRTTITDPNGAMLEDHIIRRNPDQCETQHHHAFADGPEPPSRLMTFTIDPRNRVTGCITEVRLFSGFPTLVESDVHYMLDARGRRLSTTGGNNPGSYSSSALLPLFDHQVGQYSSWPGGDVHWTDTGDLAFLGRTGGGISLVYDAWSRLVEVLDNNGASVASYAYDAQSRRTRSSVASNDPLVPPVTTFFLYDGPDCIQELDENGVPELSFAISNSIRHCIITKNGSTLYPNGGGGGGSSTDFEYPILPADKTTLKDMPVDDDITMTFPMVVPGGGTGPRRNGGTRGAECTLLTTATGAPYERFASDDSGQAIFLTSDGFVIPGATASSIGYRWLQPASAWCPESGLYQCVGGLYSPELGQPVSAHKTKPKKEPIGVNGEGKKEYVGHISLLK